jgi:hypothetical protein
MKAFVAHSYNEKDKFIVSQVIEMIQGFGIEVLTGEKYGSYGISKKIRERIDQSDIFIAIFTRREKIDKNVWSTSSWVVEEKGYFIGKKGDESEIVIIVEDCVDVHTQIGGLHADREYCTFNRYGIDELMKTMGKVLEKYCKINDNKKRLY